MPRPMNQVPVTERLTLALFELYDTEGSGEIDFETFHTICYHVFPELPTVSNVRELFVCWNLHWCTIFTRINTSKLNDTQRNFHFYSYRYFHFSMPPVFQNRLCWKILMFIYDQILPARFYFDFNQYWITLVRQVCNLFFSEDLL